MVLPEQASRSPSIKDERNSINNVERPRNILGGDKNPHNIYFKIQSSEKSLKKGSPKKFKDSFVKNDAQDEKSYNKGLSTKS